MDLNDAMSNSQTSGAHAEVIAFVVAREAPARKRGAIRNSSPDMIPYLVHPDGILVTV